MLIRHRGARLPGLHSDPVHSEMLWKGHRNRPYHGFGGKKAGIGQSLLQSPEDGVFISTINVRSRPADANMLRAEILHDMQASNSEILVITEVICNCSDVVSPWSAGFQGIGFDHVPVDWDPARRVKQPAGVGLLLGARAISAWTASGKVLEHYSHRVVRLKLQAHHGFINIIGCYAPPSNLGAHAYDCFMDNVQRALDAVPAGEMVMVVGDLNASAGRRAKGDLGALEERTIGPFGFGKRNDSGEKLVSMCISNALVVGNSWFRHPGRQSTWRDLGNGKPDQPSIDPTSGKMVRQQQRRGRVSDYILMSSSMKKWVSDVKVFGRTATGKQPAGFKPATMHTVTDHQWVRCKVNLKLKAAFWSRAPKGIDPEGFKDEAKVANFVRIVIAELATTPLASLSSPAAVEEKLSQALQKGMSEAIGRRQQVMGNPWLSDPLRKILRKKELLRARMQHHRTPHRRAEFKDFRRHCKQRVRIAKAKYMDTQATQIQEAADSNYPSKVFNFLSKKASSRLDNAPREVLDEDGKTLLTDPKKILERWKCFFAKLLNVASTVNVAEVKRRAADELTFLPPLASECEELNAIPTRDEVVKAVSKLQHRSAVGKDRIPANAIRCGGPIVMEWYTVLIQQSWCSGAVPAVWLQSVIVPLPKKGDRKQCDNWRGISLIPIPSKILTNVIIGRLQKFFDQRLGEEQVGFRKGRSCLDAIFGARMLHQHCRGFNQARVAAFLDLRKAYDSVDRSLLWEILSLHGVNGAMLRAIQSLYGEGSSSVVRVGGSFSDCFNVASGVRQGCPLSPLLFNVFLDFAIKRWLKAVPDSGISVESSMNNSAAPLVPHLLRVLLYADDAVVFAKDRRSLATMLLSFHRIMTECGLQVNYEKSKVMHLSVSAVQAKVADATPLQVGVEVGAMVPEPVGQLEVVPSFKYLGSFLSNDGLLHNEINNRKKAAAFCFRQLCGRVFQRKGISSKTKGSIYTSMVLSTLLYGCDAWAPQAVLVQDIMKEIMWQVRLMVGVRRMDKLSNSSLLSTVGVEHPAVTIQHRRLTWFGHVCRMDGARWAHILLHCKSIDGVDKKRPGSPGVRWETLVLNDCGLRSDETKLMALVKLAQERVEWSTKVNSIRADSTTMYGSVNAMDNEDHAVSSSSGSAAPIGGSPSSQSLGAPTPSPTAALPLSMGKSGGGGKSRARKKSSNQASIHHTQRMDNEDHAVSSSSGSAAPIGGSPSSQSLGAPQASLSELASFMDNPCFDGYSCCLHPFSVTPSKSPTSPSLSSSATHVASQPNRQEGSDDGRGGGEWQHTDSPDGASWRHPECAGSTDEPCCIHSVKQSVDAVSRDWFGTVHSPVMSAPRPARNRTPPSSQPAESQSLISMDESHGGVSGVRSRRRRSPRLASITIANASQSTSDTCEAPAASAQPPSRRQPSAGHQSLISSLAPKRNGRPHASADTVSREMAEEIKDNALTVRHVPSEEDPLGMLKEWHCACGKICDTRRNMVDHLENHCPNIPDAFKSFPARGLCPICQEVKWKSDMTKHLITCQKEQKVQRKKKSQ